MEPMEREFRECATEIVKLCDVKGFNLKQIGSVCEFVVECVTITENNTSRG